MKFGIGKSGLKALDIAVIDWIVMGLAFALALEMVEAFFYRSGLSFRALGSVFAIAMLAGLLFIREKIAVRRIRPQLPEVKNIGVKHK